MEKSAGRQSSVPPRASGQDSKKDGNTHGKKKGGQWRESRPKHEGIPQRRMAQQPHKFRPADKRPRARGNYNDSQKQEMNHGDADYGSLFKPGAKKHTGHNLLNFTIDDEDTGGRGRGSERGYSRDNKMVRHQRVGGLRYNKEQFLQANCQFVVADGEDFSVHSADPDTLVDWSLIEQVRLCGESVPSCPICLYTPIAAKITRCGHIYCWPCILHYLSLSEKTWAKCPICFESVHEKDLKSVAIVTAPAAATKDVISMTLMKRVRNSTYAAPVGQWCSTYKQPYNVQQEEVDVCFAKLLTARPSQIQELILDVERRELAAQLQKEDFGSLEASYIEAALMALAKRESHVALKVQSCEKLEGKLKKLTLNDATSSSDMEKRVKPASKSDAKPMKSYKCAFDDEEESQKEKVEVEEKAQDEVQHSVQQMASKDEYSTASGQSSSRHSNPQVGSVEVVRGNEDSQDQGLGEDAVAGAATSDVSGADEDHRPQPQHRKPNQMTGVYYFYQAASGQQIYLHSLNARCLVREYGSLELCPPTISAVINHVDACSMTEELRSRHRYISHLPLTCEFQVVELNLQPPLISKATLDSFKEEIQRRHRDRKRKEQAENRTLKKMQENENRRAKNCPQLRASLGGIQLQDFPEMRSVIVPSEAPNLRTASSVSDSPTGTSFDPAVSSPVDEEDSGQFSALSYSKILRTGKAKPQESVSGGSSKASGTPSWPTVTSSPTANSRSRETAQSDDDTEDRVPEYHESFQFDFQVALNQAKANQAVAGDAGGPAAGAGSGGKKKKKMKTLPLFSTTMNRHT